jgi:hypothetical protein
LTKFITLQDVLAQNAKKSAGVFWEYDGSSMLRVPFPTKARSQEIERKEGPSVTASAVMQGVSSASYFVFNSVNNFVGLKYVIK